MAQLFSLSALSLLLSLLPESPMPGTMSAIYSSACFFMALLQSICPMLSHSLRNLSSQHSPSLPVVKRMYLISLQIESLPLTTLSRFMVLMYMSAYMSINSRSPPDQIQSQILVVHFALGIITPVGQLLRALII